MNLINTGNVIVGMLIIGIIEFAMDYTFKKPSADIFYGAGIKLTFNGVKCLR